MLTRILITLVLVCPQLVWASSAIDLNRDESGTRRTGQSEILHDAGNSYSIDEVVALYKQGKFKPLDTAGSTGLAPGSFWSHFALRNRFDQPLTIDIEYVDHQLIELAVYEASTAPADDYRQIADMSLLDPFDKRPVYHNRFAFQVTLPPRQTREFLVKFSSHQAGYVFPSMRIWSPENLRKTNNAETAIVMFLFGGIFLMSIVSMVAAIATRDKTFLTYSIYAVSKIVAWSTILGYTHQFILKEHYHWSYMSITGAISILCGTVFSRQFLQTRQYARRIDRVLIFMICNAVFLIVCAVFGLNELAIASITLALLLYPMICVAGVVRWHQGSRDAAVFALAWSLLVFGLLGQALRDLGLVQHSFVSYYWPAVASFVEMIGILTAMGLKVHRLRLEKNQAESLYLSQLEHSKSELEVLVSQRTRELEKAKEAAELEAQTDPLTGVHNRRSFFAEAHKCLKLAQRKAQPLSLLMFDIDHFKAINDTYGHSMGDEALRRFSDIVAGNLRETDVWGRIGGEEFALVLFEDRPGSLQTARRLHESIRAISIPVPSGALRFTASVGVACLAQGDNIEDFYDRADMALYEAKRRGRDCIVEGDTPV